MRFLVSVLNSATESAYAPPFADWLKLSPISTSIHCGRGLVGQVMVVAIHSREHISALVAPSTAAGPIWLLVHLAWKSGTEAKTKSANNLAFRWMKSVCHTSFTIHTICMGSEELFNAPYVAVMLVFKQKTQIEPCWMRSLVHQAPLSLLFEHTHPHFAGPMMLVDPLL